MGSSGDKAKSGIFPGFAVLVLIVFSTACSGTGQKHPEPLFPMDPGYASIERIEVFAECNGNNGPYITEIHSFDDGYYYFHQKYMEKPGEFKGVLHDTLGFSIGIDEGARTRLDKDARAILRGHDFHRMVLLPEQFFHDVEWSGDTTIQSKTLEVYSGTDAHDLPVRLYYDAADSLVTRIEMRNPVQTHITLTLIVDDWRPTEYGRIPYHAMIIQPGTGTFEFRYNRIEFNNFETAKKLEDVLEDE